MNQLTEKSMSLLSEALIGQDRAGRVEFLVSLWNDAVKFDEHIGVERTVDLIKLYIQQLMEKPEPQLEAIYKILNDLLNVDTTELNIPFDKQVKFANALTAAFLIIEEAVYATRLQAISALCAKQLIDLQRLSQTSMFDVTDQIKQIEQLQVILTNQENNQDKITAIKAKIKSGELDSLAKAGSIGELFLKTLNDILEGVFGVTIYKSRLNEMKKGVEGVDNDFEPGPS